MIMEHDRYSELTEWEIKDIEDDRDKYYDLHLATLDRLHQCKRRNREDKVKLRNDLVAQDSYIGQLEETNNSLEHTCDELWLTIESKED